LLKKLVYLFLIFPFLIMAQQKSLLENQLKYERVQSAYNEKLSFIQKDFETKKLQWPPSNILFRAFKNEAQLELWLKQGENYIIYKTYNVCYSSGKLGPKRKEGDLQVPEGFYFIDRFNPQSNFYLSLGINYPNESDKILSDKLKPGSDIFIHGACVSVGCLPMTDDKIKEIYIIALLAKQGNGQKIPVHIYPFKFSLLNKFLYYSKYSEQVVFWKNLEEEYLNFEKNKKLRKINIDKNGKYIFENL